MKPKDVPQNEKRLADIIKSYKSLRAKRPDTWSEFAAQQSTLKDAITVSALSINKENKRCPHQYRIPKAVLEQAKHELLINIGRIRKAKSFDDLYTIVKTLGIFGIGELTAYDIAVRIGAYLKLNPDRVYLHAGTRVGAKTLLGEVSGDYLFKSDLPKAFRGHNLKYGEIEDILCIYKDRFRIEAVQKVRKSRC